MGFSNKQLQQLMQDVKNEIGLQNRTITSKDVERLAFECEDDIERLRR